MTTEAKPATSPDDSLKAEIKAAEAPVVAAKSVEAPMVAPKSAGETVTIDPSEKAPAAAKNAAKTSAVIVAARRFAADLSRTEPRAAAIAGTALMLGTILGAGAMSFAGSREAAPNAAIVSLAGAIDAGRSDTAKIAHSLTKLEQAVAELKTATDGARRDSKGSTVGEKLAQLDRNLTTKLAGLGERIDQAEREQATRLTTLAARTAAKAEPTQTGSLAEPREKPVEAKPAEPRQAEAKPIEVRKIEAKLPEAKPVEGPRPVAGKPPVLEQYALRDIFEGAAIIENRNRRLFQVAPGDVLPGAGRVEGIERQGRSWVVVTRQGIVTPQTW